MNQVAGHLDWSVLDDEERKAYRTMLKKADRLTMHRTPLPKVAEKRMEDALSLVEFRDGYVNPIGNLCFNWTQVFNRAEFASDRDAMSDVTHVLRAVSNAFWKRREGAPGDRGPADRDLLNRLGTTARRYLDNEEEQLVLKRPDAFARLATHLAETLKDPFFVRMSSDTKALLTRRHLTARELEDLAAKATGDLFDALLHGYGYASIKADLPSDFAVASRREAVRTIIHEALVHGRFEVGPEGVAVLADLGPSLHSADAVITPPPPGFPSPLLSDSTSSVSRTAGLSAHSARCRVPGAARSSLAP